MTRKEVATLVSNPRNSDCRVAKEVKSLAKADYEVRVFCVWPRGLAAPVFEKINGVRHAKQIV
jgi:hypothetical protein